LVIDYDDWSNDDFDDFEELLWFINDEASSWRWFAPKGCTLRANEHSFDDSDYPGNRTRTLVGDGSVVPAEDLGEVPNDANDPDTDEWMEDTISSIQFFENCADYYNATIGVAWDLNDDGIFETVGDNVTFSAAQLDGPSVETIPVQAQHPTDTTEELGQGQTSLDVVVANVAPQIGSFALFDSNGFEVGSDIPFALVNVPYTAKAIFTDPGTLDHQTAMLAWGDGVSELSAQFESFSDTFGGALGELAHSHTYAASGNFALELTVTDDDAGTTFQSITLTVLTPEQALETIIDAIDALIESASTDTQRNALENARDKLDGNIGGDAENGALDMLIQGNKQAALVKLNQAIEDLQEVDAAGVNVGALIALLQNVIASVEAT
jgi:hypothetical protein